MLGTALRAVQQRQLQRQLSDPFLSFPILSYLSYPILSRVIPYPILLPAPFPQHVTALRRRRARGAREGNISPRRRTILLPPPPYYTAVRLVPLV